jgi:hypothetical protein
MGLYQQCVFAFAGSFKQTGSCLCGASDEA